MMLPFASGLIGPLPIGPRSPSLLLRPPRRARIMGDSLGGDDPFSASMTTLPRNVRGEAQPHALDVVFRPLDPFLGPQIDSAPPPLGRGAPFAFRHRGELECAIGRSEEPPRGGDG